MVARLTFFRRRRNANAFGCECRFSQDPLAGPSPNGSVNVDTGLRICGVRALQKNAEGDHSVSARPREWCLLSRQVLPPP